eukprot:SAG11_NODE_26645_length_342_cov_1.477366_1_plen_28_part_10
MQLYRPSVIRPCMLMRVYLPLSFTSTTT